MLNSYDVLANSQRHPYQLPIAEFSKGEDGYYVNQADAYYREYMWKSFVALSWPNQVDERGKADSEVTEPASKSPLVWETWPQPQEVFLLPSSWGDNYPDWKHIPDLPAGMTISKTQDLCLGFDQQKDVVLYAINQPNVSTRAGAVAPLIDQYGRYVRYQVTLNRTYFEYVAENKYYDASVQEAAVLKSELAQYSLKKTAPKGAFQPLPFDHAKKPGMIETKAAWRVLDPEFDDPSRYYVRPGFVLSPDQTKCERAPAGLGLVALHIHRATRLSHVASTFEHIDNVEVVDSRKSGVLSPSLNPGTRYPSQQNIWPPYGNSGFQGMLPPVITAKDSLPPRHLRQANNISRATAITSAVMATNQEFQARYGDSPLAFYQMIDVQHVHSDCRMKPSDDFSKPMKWIPDTCPYPNTLRLINVALESYTQLVNPFTHQATNYSCQGCHSEARPCGFSAELKNELTFKPEFQVMSYLLSKAKFPGQHIPVADYSCNNPASQSAGKDIRSGEPGY